MQIYGLMKTTLLDYPGKVASTIFLGGCNFRCPFCHNMDLVTGLDNIEPVPTEDVMKHLKSRSGVIDGVCITGGEPTLQPELNRLIRSIKDLGLLVKLDTNGSNAAVLKNLLSENLVDYIAIDIKSSFSSYDKVCGLLSTKYGNDALNDVITNVSKSISLLIDQKAIPYEFRTTVIREYHDDKEMELIGDMLTGARAYYLQNYVCSDFVPDKTLHGYTKEELLSFADKLSHKIKKVGIRGID
ncbi:MAG: anaerobic ribonucleoside-triphosphate reductase activating protein [Lachnospiraceae bacterium]|nr:anaerobic ribonucleoside-triphosphate reductase activating protein [Lachnospiraceae bacterium]